MQFLSRARPSPNYLATKFSIRWHSSELLQNSLSGSNGRLRLGEEQYANDMSTPMPMQAVLSDLHNETKMLFQNSHMMISNAQAKLHHQIIAIQRPKRVLEIGTFTGFSAIAMASALPPKATLVSLEISKPYADVARRYVEKAQLQDRVEIKDGPAMDSLEALSRDKLQFDTVFLEIYSKSNESLDTLSDLWESMLTILQIVSATSAKSLTAEPDLAAIQKARRDYEALLTKLKSSTEWLDANNIVQDNPTTVDHLCEEQADLRKESAILSDQLKRLLSQSYALQFQINILLASSHDQPVGSDR
ncbi:hypothetical protein DFQ28_003731 [Apophysomyces sp. BC1034]|nr:hypothetical protein DFQ28_003731 [Apophysomyces sp. BC1034]